MADSGAGSTNETFRYSESIFAIFKNFDLKFSELTSIKVLENNCENKASLWTDFKNSFAWLTGMKNMIFHTYNFFCSGHFLIFDFLKNDQKMARTKKVCNTKNHIFHACQPREGIFEICSYWGLIFTTVCSNFKQLFPNFDRFFQKIFLLKSLQMVRTLTRNTDNLRSTLNCTISATFLS